MSTTSIGNITSAPLKFYERYTQRGWRVIPVHSVGPKGKCRCGNAICNAPGKRPYMKDWPSVATGNADVINRWINQYPMANIGIVTGKASGLVVLDIDPDKGGMESLEMMEKEHGLLPLTPTVTHV